MLQKSNQFRVVMVFLTLLLFTALLSGSAGAAPDAISRVNVSNARDVAFTVSWVTTSASNGTVTWGTSKPPGTAVADTVSSTTTHYVTISGLTPNTTYYFQVSSGADLDNNGGAYYSVTTGQSLLSNPGNIIYGNVYQSNGITVAPNAIVYLQIQDDDGSGSPGSSQLVSARANGSGAWNYNLGNVRTSNSQAYFNFTYGVDKLRLIGQGGNQGTFGLDPNPFIILAPTTSPFQQHITLNQAPTAVTLASFTGSSHPNSVLLDWVTFTETGLAGFNLYRSETPDGMKSKLNPSLIQAKTPGSPTGNSYQYRDGTVVSGKTYFYWIELEMQGGIQEEHGPISITTASYWIWLPVVK